MKQLNKKELKTMDLSKEEELILQEYVAIHFREHFSEKINEAAKQKRIKDYEPF